MLLVIFVLFFGMMYRINNKYIFSNVISEQNENEQSEQIQNETISTQGTTNSTNSTNATNATNATNTTLITEINPINENEIGNGINSLFMDVSPYTNTTNMQEIPYSCDIINFDDTGSGNVDIKYKNYAAYDRLVK
jgi:hypothetical protein